nr:class I SAM-dependent methyltransferase [Chloroflexota bacterium]
MLDAEAKLSLQRRYFPRLYERTFEPIQVLLQNLVKDSVVLDAGCSGGTWLLQPYRTQLRLLVGTDICVPTKLPDMPFVLSDLNHAPFADDTFDLIVCYNVIEHLSQPQQVFAEFRRILRVGGALVFKTSSLFAPVIALSRFTPHRLHQRVKKALVGATETEVFPTHYRCNTPAALEQCLRKMGFCCKRLLVVDQTYEYLAFSRLSYILGLLYSRAIQAGPFRVLGTGIAGVYMKSASCE